MAYSPLRLNLSSLTFLSMTTSSSLSYSPTNILSASLCLICSSDIPPCFFFSANFALWASFLSLFLFFAFSWYYSNGLIFFSSFCFSFFLSRRSFPTLVSKPEVKVMLISFFCLKLPVFSIWSSCSESSSSELMASQSTSSKFLSVFSSYNPESSFFRVFSICSSSSSLCSSPEEAIRSL